MQEHIRRAHPDHYIPKLPATEESFSLMINTPPSERPPPPPQATHQAVSHAPSVGPPGQYCSPHSIFAVLTEEGGHGIEGPSFYRDPYAYDQPRSSDEYRRHSILPASSAAEVLAQLHDGRATDIHWDAEPVCGIHTPPPAVKSGTSPCTAFNRQAHAQHSSDKPLHSAQHSTSARMSA